MRYLRYALTSPRAVLLVALVLFTTVLTVAPRATSLSAVVNPTSRPSELIKSGRPPLSTLAEAAVPLSPPTTTAIGSVLITIRHTGFEPSVITRHAGKAFLVVQNRSGFQNVQLRLDRAGGSQLYDVEIPRSKPDWVQVVDLQPGTYILADAYHPDWGCKIVVTN